jgi:phage terminase large subunit-like protein
MAEIIRCLPADSYRYNVADLHIYLDNGAEIVGFSAEKPSRLRGRNLAFAWCDELASFERPDQLWSEALLPAVRIGVAPRIAVTTTPRPIGLLRGLLERSDGSVVVTRGSTWDNAANLSDYALSELKSRYENTRVGRQELYGELLTDVEGALWTQEMIDAAYWPVPTGRTIRTVTAVDPSGSATGDATGIVTATLDSWSVVHVVADDTTKGSPEHRYASVCRAALRHSSGVILYEAAYGGDNIAHGIRAAWPLVAGATPLPLLVASPTKSSKADRAHPVAALYEQTMSGTPRVVHDAPLRLLADEMTTWEPRAAWSPNRLDALVHVVRFLHSGSSGVARISTFDGLAEFPTLPIGVGA